MEIECGLENIPVFVRQGSLLPMQEDDHLMIHVYPPELGQSASYRLYSDAGDGSPVPGEQEFRMDDFQVTHRRDALEITWQNEGSYPLPYSQIDLELHGFDISQATLDGDPLQITGKRIHLLLPTGVNRTIVIK